MFQSRFIIRLQDLYTNKFQPYFVIESFIFQNVLQKKKKITKSTTRLYAGQCALREKDIQ